VIAYDLTLPSLIDSNNIIDGNQSDPTVQVPFFLFYYFILFYYALFYFILLYFNFNFILFYLIPHFLIYQTATIQNVCTRAQAVCTGANTQYASITDCISQLTAKPYGTFADAWSDTVVCRILHVVLAAVDPTVHCPHVGPTGGGKVRKRVQEKIIDQTKDMNTNKKTKKKNR
jgi:hypothetical protein